MLKVVEKRDERKAGKERREFEPAISSD